MILSLDDMLTDVDASHIPVIEKSPLSLDRIIQNTISNCNDYSRTPIHFRRRFHLSLVAAILIGLLATTALAATIAGYLKTVNIEYQVSDDGEILPPEVPDLGITLSVSSVSPTGLELTSFIETAKDVGTISAGSEYYLEMQTDSGWLVVPMLYENQWQWDNEKISGVQYSWNIDWTSIYGELAPGSYRIQKPFTVTSNDGAVKTYCISKEFIIKSNPADRVEKPRKAKYEATIYNQSELDKLFKVVKGDPLELAVILGAFYGLRRSEVVGLKWDAIDFERKTISIRHTVVQFTIDGKTQVVQKDSTKTKSSCRTLPLVAPFETLLRYPKAEQAINQKVCGNCYCQDYLDYILCRCHGRTYQAQLYHPALRSASQKARYEKDSLPRSSP